MTPAEVLAMRDRLAEEVGKVKANPVAIAEWLIESGWVTEEPKEKNDEV